EVLKLAQPVGPAMRHRPMAGFLSVTPGCLAIVADTVTVNVLGYVLREIADGTAAFSINLDELNPVLPRTGLVRVQLIEEIALYGLPDCIRVALRAADHHVPVYGAIMVGLTAPVPIHADALAMQRGPHSLPRLLQLPSAGPHVAAVK